jgi:GntR family transcriptional regulator
MRSASPAPPPFAQIAPESVGMPLYRAAKRALLQAIESGAYPPGSALPSETRTASALGVSIGTLRRAVDELSTDQVLVRRHGRGTFVATCGSDRFPHRFEPINPAGAGREPARADLVRSSRARADAEVARALGLPTGSPVLQFETCLSLRGSVVIWELLTLPAARFKGLTARRFRDRPGGVYQLYQSAFGTTVLRTSERARAVAADRFVARALALCVGDPVMQVRRSAYTFGDTPVEYRVSMVNTAHHEYVSAEAQWESAA